MNYSGVFIDTGKGYKAFSPTQLKDVENKIQLNDIYPLIDEANTSIGELRALETLLPNPDLLLRKYALKEALLSSEIEGTQSTLIEVLENQNNNEGSLSIDVKEVLNYQKALNHGINKIKNENFPLCVRLLKECHSILMKNVRGGEPEKTRGEFRSTQNWIGGTSPADAIFVPPKASEINTLLADIEKNIHESKFPQLVKIALIHYQFETIHPFLDGNGRIGRLLINLFLVEKKILNYPTLYLSLYLKEHKQDYYSKLTNVRNNGNYKEWIKFFLKGLIDTSQQIMKTTRSIQELGEKDKQKSNSKNEYLLLNYLLLEPFVDIKMVEKELKIANMTANTLVRKFESKSILMQINDNKRYKKYIYKEYIDIMNAGLQN